MFFVKYIIMMYTDSDFKIIKFEKTHLNSTNKLFKHRVKSLKLHAQRHYNAKAGAYLYIFKHLVIISFLRDTPTCQRQ